jgi:hypothetical protein
MTALDNIRELVMRSEFDEAENATAALAAALPETRIGKRITDKEVAGLDVAKGLQRYDGDEKTYLKVLRSYVASVRSMLNAIDTVSEDKLADYKIKVHGIKGASFDIFADQIGEKAKALEEAAEASDFGYIKEHNPAFLAAARKSIGDFEEFLSSVKAQKQKPNRDKPDNTLLLKLLDSCETYDMNGMEAAMAEIEKYQYESDGGLAEWLREKVDMMNVTQIVERLESLRLDSLGLKSPLDNSGV